MKVLKKIIIIIALAILTPILFVSAVILVDSHMNPDEIPSFFGWKPFIVLSGSMETEIYSGDVAVVKEDSSYKKGDIIAFKSDDNIVITHRIVEIIQEDGKTKYVTKGDNNNSTDRGHVLPEQVEGIYQFKISRLGNLAMFVQTPIGMLSCLSIPIAFLLILQIIENKKNKSEFEDKSNREKNLQEEIEKLKKQNKELMKR